jgi:excisionase family DNA binding protein
LIRIGPTWSNIEKREIMEKHKEPAKPESRYLTTFEVANACGVSARTVSNWIRDGSIPAHRTVGGHARVSADDLRQFLSDRKMPLPEHLSGTGTPRVDPQKKRVLIIDDDESLLEVYRELLGSAGYEVETARHGFLGGYLLAHCRPDVILLDIMMPGLDGYEVLQLIRKRPEAKGIPVLACTSLRGPEVEGRIGAAGFAAFVRKPIDFAGLRETLAKLLGSAL